MQRERQKSKPLIDLTSPSPNQQKKQRSGNLSNLKPEYKFDSSKIQRGLPHLSQAFSYFLGPISQKTVAIPRPHHAQGKLPPVRRTITEQILDGSDDDSTPEPYDISNSSDEEVVMPTLSLESLPFTFSRGSQEGRTLSSSMEGESQEETIFEKKKNLKRKKHKKRKKRPLLRGKLLVDEASSPSSSSTSSSSSSSASSDVEEIEVEEPIIQKPRKRRLDTPQYPPSKKQRILVEEEPQEIEDDDSIEEPPSTPSHQYQLRPKPLLNRSPPYQRFVPPRQDRKDESPRERHNSIYVSSGNSPQDARKPLRVIEPKIHRTRAHTHRQQDEVAITGRSAPPQPRQLTDEELARKLQAEEYSKGERPLPPRPPMGYHYHHGYTEDDLRQAIAIIQRYIHQPLFLGTYLTIGAPFILLVC